MFIEFSVLVNIEKCVIPNGPATATKSFKTLFFRTCKPRQQCECVTQDSTAELSSSREEHLQRSGSEGLHDSSHVCHELSHVHADLSAVKHEGVRHSGVSFLGHKTGGLAGFLLVFSLGDENRKIAHRIILPSICIAIKLKRSYTLFCQELEH